MHRAWKQRAVAVAVLCVLAGLPIASAVCGTVCGASETATVPTRGDRMVLSMPQHHHESSPADHVMSSMHQQRIASTIVHECGATDDALLQSEAALLARGDANGLVLAQSPALVCAAHKLLVTPLGLERHGPARLASAPACTTLVLRV